MAACEIVIDIVCKPFLLALQESYMGINTHVFHFTGRAISAAARQRAIEARAKATVNDEAFEDLLGTLTAEEWSALLGNIHYKFDRSTILEYSDEGLSATVSSLIQLHAARREWAEKAARYESDAAVYGLQDALAFELTRQDVAYFGLDQAEA